MIVYAFLTRHKYGTPEYCQPGTIFISNVPCMMFVDSEMDSDELTIFGAADS